MNKKGFTLIEILTVIIIIGIGSTIAIVAVTNNILKSKSAVMVNLAKNYLESTRSMKGKDTLYYEPKNDEAVILPCNSINGAEIEHKDTTGYGEVLSDYCYVGITKDGNSNFLYYMTLVDDTYHSINGIEYNKISEDDVLDGEQNLNNISAVSSPLSSFSVKYDDNYLIRAVRVKYSATYNDGGIKSATLYGYYTNDNTENSANAQIKGTIEDFDNFAANVNKNVTVNGRNYDINQSEILYIITKK